MRLPDLNDIYAASELINPFINRTPVMASATFNKMLGCELFFKCENFQKVGAFKFRGACNSVFSLSAEDALRGVATHSSGNHAQALALAASMRGIPAYIVMPSNSPIVKKSAVEGYGATITYCEPTLQAREETLNSVVNQTGAKFIHPYNNFKVISGQGTATLELVETIKDLDFIIAPVGGGGLLSGTLTTASSLSPNTKVIAAEPQCADDAFRSIQSGVIQPSINPKTICDGLLTSLGDLTFEIIRKHIYKIITVADDAIIFAMKLIWERMKIIVEPSSAIVLALIFENKEMFRNKKVGLILSGGNVDLNKLPWSESHD